MFAHVKTRHTACCQTQVVLARVIFLWQRACWSCCENIENLHQLVAHWWQKSILVCCNPFFHIDWIFHFFSRWLSRLSWAELCWNVTYQHSCHGRNRISKFSGGGTPLPSHGWKAAWTLSLCALWDWDWDWDCSFVQEGPACISVLAGCIAIIDQSIETWCFCYTQYYYQYYHSIRVHLQSCTKLSRQIERRYLFIIYVWKETVFQSNSWSTVLLQGPSVHQSVDQKLYNWTVVHLSQQHND